MASSRSRRVVQRNDRVRQRRARTTKPKREARHLPKPSFDLARLATQTYLSIPEFAEYGNFESENAARLFLSRGLRSRNPKAVRPCHRGRRTFVRRVDYDRYMQASMERHDDQCLPGVGAGLRQG